LLNQAGLRARWYPRHAISTRISARNRLKTLTRTITYSIWGTWPSPLGLPVLSIPASLLIELLLFGLLLNGADVPYLLERKWISPLEPPPPRFSFSS
jgi:hypothetical protein